MGQPLIDVLAALTASLRNYSGRKRTDRMFDSAVRDRATENRKREELASRILDLPEEFVEKVTRLAAKANVNINTVVGFASQEHQTESPQRASLRRRFDRVPIDNLMVYSTSGGHAWRDARMTDLSGGGARMSTAVEVPQGSELMLGFSLLRSGPKIITRGRVVMSFFDGSTKRYSHGLVFTAIADFDQEAIAAFIARA